MWPAVAIRCDDQGRAARNTRFPPSDVAGRSPDYGDEENGRPDITFIARRSKSRGKKVRNEIMERNLAGFSVKFEQDQLRCTKICQSSLPSSTVNIIGGASKLKKFFRSRSHATEEEPSHRSECCHPYISG